MSNVKKGTEHKMQQNGTCSMKCILAFLRNELGPEEYRRFKVFMTKESIRKFERFMEANGQENREKHEEMLREANLKLEKRIKKCDTPEGFTLMSFLGLA